MNFKLSKILSLMVLFPLFQICWAGELTDVSGKGAEGSYEFDKFYDDVSKWKDYTETDREVCQELPKLLNLLHPKPMACLIDFPEESDFKNIDWSTVKKTTALNMERVRTGKSQGSIRCQGAENVSLEDFQIDGINEGRIFYQSSHVDADNDGVKDQILRRVDDKYHCIKGSEMRFNKDVHMLYVCTSREGKIIDVSDFISSRNVFRYRDKNYLFSWNPVGSKAYININEYRTAKAGSSSFGSVRQICRIKYNNWGEG